MPERTLDDVRRFVGNGVARLIELAVPEGTAPEVFEQTLAIFREYYDIHCNDNTKAYDGSGENSMVRTDKENYYLDIAETVLERGTCLRRNYGAVEQAGFCGEGTGGDLF